MSAPITRCVSMTFSGVKICFEPSMWERNSHPSSLSFQFPDACEREHLKSSRVGEDGSVPCVEAVQPSCRPEHLESWPEVEVVGVSQDDAGTDVFAQLPEMHALHAAAGSHGHEDGGGDVAVVGVQHAGAGTGSREGLFQVECHCGMLFSGSTLRSMGFDTTSSVRAKSHTSRTFST